MEGTPATRSAFTAAPSAIPTSTARSSRCWVTTAGPPMLSGGPAVQGLRVRLGGGTGSAVTAGLPGRGAGGRRRGPAGRSASRRRGLGRGRVCGARAAGSAARCRDPAGADSCSRYPARAASRRSHASAIASPRAARAGRRARGPGRRGRGQSRGQFGFCRSNIGYQIFNAV
jgi:hypothetical protein